MSVLGWMAAFALGLGAGAISAWSISWLFLSRARRWAQAHVAEIAQAAEVHRSEQTLALRQELLERQSHAAHQRAEQAQTLAETERHLDERERALMRREAALQRGTELVSDHAAMVERLRADSETLVARAHEVRETWLGKLEVGAGVKRHTLVERRVHDRVEKARLRARMRVRWWEKHMTQNQHHEGRRIITAALHRYNGRGHLERLQNTLAVDCHHTLHAFSDPDGHAHTAFAETTGCSLDSDHSAKTLTVRGDDPLGREVARRVLKHVAAHRVRAPDAVRQVATEVRGQIDDEIQRAAREALDELGLASMHDELMHLVGRLRYRLSHSQNQWKHSIEVGHLAGIMAHELGLDVELARRGGLLHDIGKAISHEQEGSHAVLGAELARRCGEHETVANAIGSHHNDENPDSPIAFIVTAADAMSGARPGARRESVTSYLKRIRSIERIARRSSLVHRVDVMHAGREVRVFVADEERGFDVHGYERFPEPEVTDEGLHPLAQDIAEAIEDEITFAGQIRVVVIRESRSIAYAH